MAVNAYLIIDGVDGPSKSRSKAIDIFSFSFGTSLAANFQAGASGGESRVGRASLSDVSITKATDHTSPTLFDYGVRGEFFKQVEIIYDKAVGGAKQEDYFKITMENAVVSNFNVSGSSENPTESISFAFRKIKLSYNPEKDDGSLAGFVDKGFDAASLEKW
jgi:type VI secretion system secreted protein Hcp